MRFIETDSDIQWLNDKLNQEESVWIPINSSSSLHPVNNSISFIYIYFISSTETAGVSISHNDVHSIPLNAIDTSSRVFNVYIYQTNRSPLWASMGFLDISLIYWLDTGNHIDTNEVDKIYSFMNSWYRSSKNDNNIIPVTKHIEYCDALMGILLPIVRSFKPSECFEIYNDTIIPTMESIEANGLCVNENKFRRLNPKYPLRNEYAYSKYDIYTTTGRPSCHFGGVNFVALSKENGSREPYVSRFKSGKLIEFDFDSFHVRLIADCIGYKFEDKSIHHHFAKLYFDKNEISDDEYEVAKKITFRELYSLEGKYTNIDFFNKVHDLADDLWTTFRMKNYIQTLIFGRKLYKENLYDITKNKLFNYYIQSLEFESSVMIMHDIQKYLKDFNTKLVLYTYDSLLFDVDPSENKTALAGIYNILNDKYPVKIKAGTDYNSMQEIKSY